MTREREEVKLVSVKGLGKAFFRPLSKWQPDPICRTCGRTTEKEVTTEKPSRHGGIAMPCCETQQCYNGHSTRKTVIDQIKSIS